jgi:hypothetical protein
LPKTVPLKELWQHLAADKQERILDRLTIVLHRQLPLSKEEASDE